MNDWLPTTRGQVAVCSLLAALLVVAPSAEAQQNNPLASLDGPAPGLTVAALDQALPARVACQGLIRLVNESGAQWEMVRKGQTMTGDYQEHYNDQLENWAIQWGSCMGRRKALPKGLPATVLAWEAGLIERLWLGVRSASDAYIEGADVSTINQRLATYRGAAEDWAEASRSAQEFWSGSYLPNRSEPNCVELAAASIRQAGEALWALASQPVTNHVPEAMVSVEQRLAQAELGRKDCDRSSPENAVQLRLQAQLLGVHRRGLSGFRSGDDGAIRAGMQEAQAITSRMTRCRKEYDGEEPISTVCSAPIDRADSGTEKNPADP